MENSVIQTALRRKGKEIKVEVSYIIIIDRHRGRVMYVLCFVGKRKKLEEERGKVSWQRGCYRLILSYVANRCR